ncbi:hypothetical protein [Fibrella aquatilis]|uniref:Peptidase M48 domain-containing protein n=1 Tax=Fibrella aquatilis TaxID=2817059 RepID=A0A939K052_9BACT|nr:hypothetical protein [Fibrella aquatilis]MBO0933834.1 hypothetical protein [Fibrella aquatilis]
MKTRLLNWPWLLAMVAWATVDPAQAQEPCECDLVKPMPKGYGIAPETIAFEERDAREMIQTLVKPFARQPNIIARPFSCANVSAVAKLCDTSGRSFIFYNKGFFTNLRDKTRRGDQFVLAHEVAHHLLGHTTRAYYMAWEEGQQEALKASAGTITIPQRHLHELEADALGLWMVIKQGATRANIEAIFRVLPKLLHIYDINDNKDPLHPSFAMRELYMKRQFDKLTNPTYLRRYLATNQRAMDHPPGLDDDDPNPIRRDTESFYAFHLMTAKRELLQKLTNSERVMRDSLTRRARLSVEIVGGIRYIQPSLSVDNEPVATSPFMSLVGGGRVGVGAWYKPHRFEADLLLGPQAFTTQARFGDRLLTTERFLSWYLHVRPRYVLNALTREAPNRYATQLWMLTAGPSLTVPLAFKYDNYGLIPAQTPTQQASLGLVAGAGYGVSNWRSQAGHYRLWLLYQLQPLRFAPLTTSQTSQSILHTISLEASFRFW